MDVSNGRGAKGLAAVGELVLAKLPKAHPIWNHTEEGKRVCISEMNSSRSYTATNID